MARGELMKKLLASYGRDDEFRAVAEQIILEEQKKNNHVLARSLRQTLDHTDHRAAQPSSLAPLKSFPHAADDFIERSEPHRTKHDIILSQANLRVFRELLLEFRRSDEIRRRGLPVRSKLLFCGPPGSGKTLCAEVFAAELGLPLFIVKIDRLISSYLGETAGNIRKIFEFARRQPCVVFFDEFDALARAREDASEHNELRRVVNSLLIFIDRLRPLGFFVAATNLDKSLDPAIWRRFDEIVWFDNPDRVMINRFLKMKFRNVETTFDPVAHGAAFEGYSYADIERVCLHAMRKAIIERRQSVRESEFEHAVSEEVRRRSGLIRMQESS